MRWERVIREGEKHTSFPVTGRHVAFMSARSHSLITKSPTRRQDIASSLAEHLHGAEVKFSGGKVVAVEAPVGNHIAWRGVDRGGATACLALDFGIL